jgi:hypothetical protein
VPLKGTIGERYLAETRGIDVAALPASIDEALRFHPACTFGSAKRPCLIGLMRDPLSDIPVGIHRIGLAQNNGAIDKIERRGLGRLGVIKLWRLDGSGQLVAGEGLETVLAAATRMTWHGAPLTPAWSVVCKGGLARLPVIPGVTQLIQLIDHDANNEGQKAAACGRQIWCDRTIVPLMPKQSGWDFNDVILRRRA